MKDRASDADLPVPQRNANRHGSAFRLTLFLVAGNRFAGTRMFHLLC
jgi:hypothetical protein